MNTKRYEGSLDAKGMKIALVVSRFNNFFTDKLLSGALDCLIRHGAAEKNLEVAYVPGSFEIPVVAGRLAKMKKYDAVICLGAVIRGDTPHFDFVATEASKGIARLGMDSNIPVVYGLITADTLEQAVERSGTKAGNKGWDAAQTAIEMVNLYRSIGA
ncbi:6,7-dimethyl-8-ribityllumazine synthase [candidate division GN15 bacterium]|uniref:6,7-dimethyl-8-ribityllumazine synthase n=1 Tax=candidate division GN15 bacterium TaxID=2072418 RepID=A0A855XCM4_9BACT|nr:MAG: 6,7-dimethyl-8-ribityllumazine synthase [candidate division GN15 bacterium]